MPRDATNIAQLQKQRNKIKEKAAKYPPGTVNMQFLCPSSTGKDCPLISSYTVFIRHRDIISQVLPQYTYLLINVVICSTVAREHNG